MTATIASCCGVSLARTTNSRRFQCAMSAIGRRAFAVGPKWTTVAQRADVLNAGVGAMTRTARKLRRSWP